MRYNNKYIGNIKTYEFLRWFMVKIGEFNTMKVVEKTPKGYILNLSGGRKGDGIFLPESGLHDQSPNLGDEVDAFIYRDSEDRVIASLKTPKAVVGDLALLKVVSVTKIGAFIDIGLERDVFVPVREQKFRLEIEHEYLFYMYLDKTGRLAATTDVDKYLKNERVYRVGDEVCGVCYGFQTNGSVMVAVDNKYRGVILKNEYYSPIKPGEKLSLRIKKFYEDDKMALTPRKAAVDERLQLQDTILNYLKSHNGHMPYNDDTSPEVIKNVFHQSKKYFKNALGGLMKQGLVSQDEKGTRLK
jgi:predicted RNA-binding protein (virulence factor B family)